MTKTEQRALALSARRSLSAAERRTRSERICERLQTLPALREARLILSYRALADEVDLSLLHEWFRERGQALAFPVCAAAGRMETYVPGGWRHGRLGIWEPDTADSRSVSPQELDLVLAPCVAFDAAGGRLGHGAGYYDRYLPRCEGARVYAVAFEAQRLERVAMEAHDRRMDGIVTEEELYLIN